MDKSFVPSKGRNLEGQAAAGDSGRQPSGRALPSLVLGEHAFPSEHVAAARAVSPLDAPINTAIPAQVRRLISPHVANASATIQRRMEALATLKRADRKFPKYRPAWINQLLE